MSDEEEEELMAEDGIVEVVEIDVNGNEKPGTQWPVRSSSPVSQPSAEHAEINEEELSEPLYPARLYLHFTDNEQITERMKKKWSSVYYSFFKDNIKVKYTKDKDNCKYHKFICLHPSCSSTIQQYLDKKDATSTGNLKYHVEEACKAWGPGISDVINSADNACTVSARRMIANGHIKTGNITHTFQKKDKARVMYSIRNDNFDEIWYIHPPRPVQIEVSANWSIMLNLSAGYARAPAMNATSSHPHATAAPTRSSSSATRPSAHQLRLATSLKPSAHLSRLSGTTIPSSSLTAIVAMVLLISHPATMSNPSETADPPPMTYHKAIQAAMLSQRRPSIVTTPRLMMPFFIG
jgi:hypothetical protein